MIDLWRLAAVLLGPVVGSFIGLVSLRLPAGRPLVFGRSACGTCDRALGPLDLVPIFSFLILRGRCGTCGAAIPRRYPAMELGCLAIGVASAFLFPGEFALIGAAFGWALLLIATIDAEHFWLPDRLTLPLGLVGILLAAVHPDLDLRSSLIGAAVGFGSLWLLAWAYRRIRGREGLGGGDPRLFGAIGAWVGWSGLPSVLVWASIAGFSVLAATALSGKPLSSNQRLPFGTFLAVGAWIVWHFGLIGA